MSLHYLMLAVAFVGCASCARTAMTTGANRTGPPPSARAAVYDDSQRTIAAGRELDLRLVRTLSSKTATVNLAFQAATASDLRNGPRVIVPAGSVVRGVVRGVEKADESGGSGRLLLSFATLVTNGRSAAIDGTPSRLFEPSDARDERDGGPVKPALVGGLLEALQAELTTSIIAPDGSIVSVLTGSDVALQAGTIVRIRLNAAVAIR